MAACGRPCATPAVDVPRSTPKCNPRRAGRAALVINVQDQCFPCSAVHPSPPLPPSMARSWRRRAHAAFYQDLRGAGHGARPLRHDRAAPGAAAAAAARRRARVHRALAQGVFDAFCRDMDDNLREMGISDQGVPKQMRRVGEAFYGRAQAYEAALRRAGRAVRSRRRSPAMSMRGGRAAGCGGDACDLCAAGGAIASAGQALARLAAGDGPVSGPARRAAAAAE